MSTGNWPAPWEHSRYGTLTETTAEDLSHAAVEADKISGGARAGEDVQGGQTLTCRCTLPWAPPPEASPPTLLNQHGLIVSQSLKIYFNFSFSKQYHQHICKPIRLGDTVKWLRL